MRSCTFASTLAVAGLLSVMITVSGYGLGFPPHRGSKLCAEFSHDSSTLGALWVEDDFGWQPNPGGPNPQAGTLWCCYATASNPTAHSSDQDRHLQGLRASHCGPEDALVAGESVYRCRLPWPFVVRRYAEAQQLALFAEELLDDIVHLERR